MNKTSDCIAIIGMSGRFPGAKNIDALWGNLCGGVESISFFTDEELLSSGVSAEEMSALNYVKARGVLSGYMDFDAGLFGISHQEAMIMDPQHRVFLECAWEALSKVKRTDVDEIGLFAGCGINTYLLKNLLTNKNEILDKASELQVLIANDKDFLATKVAYKLNLRGPVVSIQTACSTSLVAVHTACLSLLNHECNMALAGGVSIRVPQKTGYVFTPGSINSPDGHCRPYDAAAQGTVNGGGAGVVILKRLADAIADQDDVVSVIRGSAINNDGSLKAGYTAPSIDGQINVISKALKRADVHPEDITFVEGHGTATVLGDPIEVAALTETYRKFTAKKQYCALGSIKGNIGHLDAAAGVAGLIKAALCLKHGMLVPSLHFRTPNPKLNIETSPFYINTEKNEWVDDGRKRIAAVSSFGIGGTNAHLIMESAPAVSALEKKNEIKNNALKLNSQRIWIDPPPLSDTKRDDDVSKKIYGRADTVKSVWLKFLGIDNIKSDDDFFALGGDSLLAVNIIKEINESLFLNIPVGMILQFSVFKEFVDYVVAQKSHVSPETYSKNIIVNYDTNVSSAKSNLFVIHAAGGHVYSYRDLVRRLKKDVRVIGLQSPFISSPDMEVPDMHSLAQIMLKNIREIQADGPYYLLGSSFGGALAYEIANILIVEKNDVLFLGMVDTPDGNHVPDDIVTNADFLSYHLSNIIGGEQNFYLKNLQSLSDEEQFKKWKSYISESGEMVPELDFETHIKILEIFRRNMNLLLKYNPSNLYQEIYFFEAEQRSKNINLNPSDFWRDKVKELHLIKVPGNHITMNQGDNVKAIADVINNMSFLNSQNDYTEFEV